MTRLACVAVVFALGCSSRVSGDPTGDGTEHGFVGSRELGIQPASGYFPGQSAGGHHLATSTRRTIVFDDDGNIVFSRQGVGSASLTRDGSHLLSYRGAAPQQLFAVRIADGRETLLASGNISVLGETASRVLYRAYDADFVRFTTHSVGLDGSAPAEHAITDAQAQVFVSRDRLLYRVDPVLFSMTLAPGAEPTVIYSAPENGSLGSVRYDDGHDVLVVDGTTEVVFADMSAAGSPSMSTIARDPTLPFYGTFVGATMRGFLHGDIEARTIVLEQPGAAPITVHRAPEGCVVQDAYMVQPSDILLWREVDGTGVVRSYVARIATTLAPTLLTADPTPVTDVSFVVGSDLGYFRVATGAHTELRSVNLATRTTALLVDNDVGQMTRRGDALYYATRTAGRYAGSVILRVAMDGSSGPAAVSGNELNCRFYGGVAALDASAPLVYVCSRGVGIVGEGRPARIVTPVELAVVDSLYYGPTELLDGIVHSRAELLDRPSTWGTSAIAYRDDGTVYDSTSLFGHENAVSVLVPPGAEPRQLLFTGYDLLGAFDLTTRDGRALLSGAGIGLSYPTPESVGSPIVPERIAVMRNDASEGAAYWLETPSATLTPLLTRRQVISAEAFDAGNDELAMAVYASTPAQDGTELLLFTPDAVTGRQLDLRNGPGRVALRFTAASGEVRYLVTSFADGIEVVDASFVSLGGLPAVRFYGDAYHHAGRLWFVSYDATTSTGALASVDETCGDLQTIPDYHNVDAFFANGKAWVTELGPQSGTFGWFDLATRSAMPLIVGFTPYSLTTRRYGDLLLLRYAKEDTSPLVVIDAAAETPAVTLSLPGQRVHTFAYSAETRRVLYGASVADDWATYNVYLVDVGGGDPRPVFDQAPRFTIGSFNFNRRGDGMLYSAANVEGTMSATVELPLPER